MHRLVNENYKTNTIVSKTAFKYKLTWQHEFILQCQQTHRHQQFVWLEDLHMPKAEYKLVTMESGDQFVTILGMTGMLKLSVKC